ncbi:M23 family metallopeptidase [Helicobacter sp. 23-1045]
MKITKKTFTNLFKKRNIAPSIGVLLCALIVYFIHTSPFFERNPPQISLPNASHWNLKWDIPIKITDTSGIKRYKVAVSLNGAQKTLLNKTPDSASNEVSFMLPIPKMNIKNGDELIYTITAQDKSKNRFFRGNIAQSELKLTIDTQLPQVSVIQMSNIIVRGGAAAVVFYAKDSAMANISLTNGFQSFVAFPFYKPNYFVGIIPWYIKNPSFKSAIIAQDKAGNTRRFNINFARYNRNYRTSNLPLKSTFIEGKIAEIIENGNIYTLADFKDEISAFAYVNETIRQSDEERMNAKLLNVPREINEFATFKPANDARVVGLFGDYRKFSFNKMDAGDSWHLGVDLANIKNMPIIASNEGIVTFAEELGIYGNTIIIEHGYGVASLYSHLQNMAVKEGDFVYSGDIIARSGESGLAFGDHLHFSILLQGLPSTANEWMDSKWLKTHINDVLKNAREVIDTYAKD